MIRFPKSKKKTFLLCSSVLSVALIVGISSCIVSSGRNDHQFFPEVGNSVISAADMEYVAEEYASYEGEEVKQVVPTANGIVLVLENELVSISGKGGDVQWRYTRGSALKSVDVSPSGNRLHATFEGPAWPWSDIVHVGLSSFDGEPWYEHPSDSFLEDRRGSEFYFSEDVMAEHVPDEEVSLINFYNLDSGAVDWSVDVNSLCPSRRLTDNPDVDISPGPLSFIVSFTCSLEGGGESQSMVQLDPQTQVEAWRGEWANSENESNEAPSVYYVSGSSVPMSEHDLLNTALESTDSRLDYAFLVDGTRAASDTGYWTPHMFDFDVIRDNFPAPLENEEARPDVIIVGIPAELNTQVPLQAAKALVARSDSTAEEEGFTLFEIRGAEGMIDTVSYRNWDSSALPAVERTFISELVSALEGEKYSDS